MLIRCLAILILSSPIFAAKPCFAAKNLNPGMAYQDGFFLDSCLDSPLAVDTQSSMYFQSTYDENIDRSYERVSLNVEGEIDLGFIGGGADLTLASKMASSSIKSTYTVNYKAEFGKVYLDLEEAAIIVDDLSWDRCGNDFVYSVSYGSLFDLLVTAHFRTESAKKTFYQTYNIQVLFGLFEGSKTIKKDLLDKFSNDLVVSIEMNQRGGDLVAFENLQESLENLPCKLDYLEPCQSKFNTILDYLNNAYKDSFQDFSLDQAANLHPISIETVSYTEAFIEAPVPDTDTSTNIDLISRNISLLKQKIMESHDLITRFDLIMSLNEERINELLPIRMKFVSYINELNSGLDLCYQNRDNCSQVLDSLEKKKRPSYEGLSVEF